MRKSILWPACGAALLLSFGAAAAERCQYSAPRNADIDAAGLKVLAVELGRNDLVLRGQPDLTRIEVRGTACASDPKALPALQIATARHGDAASLVAHNGERGIVISLFGGHYAYLKLEVRLPEALATRLSVGSGDATLANVAALDATLGSGDLKVDSVAGALKLAVGSGDVHASGVGSLELTSLGSGDVGVDGIKGDVRVGSVGSGDLDLARVGGGVSLGSLGSGDVKVRGVGKGLKVDAVASGDLTVRGVTGDVAIGAVSSGDVEVADTGGNVHAGSVGSGDFGATGVGGNFSVDAVGSGDVRHSGVKGAVKIPRSND